MSTHRRITLQIRAIVEPYRDPWLQGDAPNLARYMDRATRLLDDLDDAVRPFPDLQVRLADARTELGLG